MNRQIWSLLLAALAMMTFTTAAEARRGVRLPIIIPGLGGSSEIVVKVRDLPDTEVFQREDGKYIDLGYLHKRFGEGEWVGYIGSSHNYVPFKPGGLDLMLEAAGLNALPPAPVPPKPLTSSWMFWAAILSLGLLWRLGRFITGMVASLTSSDASTPSAAGSENAAPDWARRAEKSLHQSTPARVPRVVRQPSVMPVGGMRASGLRQR